MSAPKPAAGAQFLALPAPPQRLTPAQLFTALGEKHMLSWLDTVKYSL